ncbi:MAG: Primosomal protein N' [uncultured bacterium]|nr:MAG: Primosomal protein N' [uncultured bacterium]
MYAQVVVLTYQAPDINYFTYEVPKELEKEIKVGQLVEVPFGKRSPMGVVVNIETRNTRHETRNIKTIKPISKILLNQPLLLPFQIDLVKWMSAYYLAPMVNCLGVLIPFQSSKVRPLSFPRPDLVTKKPNLNQPVQSLILVPTINRIPETMAKFPKAKNYVVYHNELKTSEKFSTWQKILSGGVDYIFGSRSAIFAPCPNLKEIIIYDEHDGAYKDERSPYFDTLTVAQKISGLTHAQLKIVDPAPKITTYFQLSNHIKMQQFQTKTKIVSMENERISGNQSPISGYLQESLEFNIKRGASCLLFLNKKKESGHMFCKSCKHQEFLQTQPERCTSCRSNDVYWNVLNVSSLAKEVKKMFPQVKVNLLLEKSELSSGTSTPAIDIGTALAIYAPLPKKYNLVANIQTDSLINLADYTAGEKFFAQITSLKRLTQPNGELVLQSYNVESGTLRFAADGNYTGFYLDQLAQRKPLSYPPFGLLIKLAQKGKEGAKIKNVAENLAKNLRSAINNPQLTILGPYQSIFWQKKPTYNIILKYKLKSFDLAQREAAIKKIKGIIGPLQKGWQLIIDPNSIN